MLDAMGKEYNVPDYEHYRKVQLVELELLKEVDKICKKHKIRYFLDGGTLLGAVRHKGFIPWDDDLDISLLRDDYEKLCNVITDELPDTMFFQDWRTEQGYPYNFAKVRMNNTKFVQTGLEQCDIHHGIYIDIFPIDKLPSDEKKRVRFNKKIKNLKIKLSVSYMSYYKNGKKRPLNQRFIIAVFKLLYDRQKLHIKADKLATSYNKTKSKLYFSNFGLLSNKLSFDESYFNETAEYEFEGELFTSVKNYDGFLKKLYGNYMNVPSESERKQKHEIIEISFN